MSDIEHVRHVWQTSDHALDELWKWAMDGGKRKERYLRFRTLQLWAADRAKAEPHEKAWGERQQAYRRQKTHILKRMHKEEAGWPATLNVAELLYHDPPHCHLASPERDKLIQIGNVLEDHYGIRVGEFPPFDVVECVHVSGSWHYRDSSSPGTPRTCAARGDGLAMDLTGTRQYEVYMELRRRYA